MSWLVPAAGLLGLASLPIIVVLHLIQQRRRRVQVPALELWTDASPTTQQRPRALPLTVPLVLRLLAALLLAAALGQPLLRRLQSAPTTTVVLLDTSLSMAASDARPTRLAVAQAEVRRLIGALGPADQLAVITLADPPRLVGRADAAGGAALVKAVAQLVPAGNEGSLQAALDLAGALVEPGRALRIMALTDTALHAPAAVQAPGPVEWRTIGQSTNNVAFVAFAARATRGGSQLYARLRNQGSIPAVRSLTVLLDGAVAVTENLRLEAGAEAEWSWPVPAGTGLAEARVSGGDDLAADNLAAVLLRGSTALRVVLVSAAPTPLERALRALPNVTVTTADPARYTTAAADLAVFVGVVPAPLPPVPTWLVAPPTSALLSFAATRGDQAAASAADQRFAALDLAALRFDHVGVAHRRPGPRSRWPARCCH